jgi:hypothetical protein
VSVRSAVGRADDALEDADRLALVVAVYSSLSRKLFGL